MNNSSITPNHPIPYETRKHSILGIASFILGILAAIFPAQALYTYIFPPPTRSFDELGAYILFMYIMYGFFSFSLSVVGLGLGIGALVQKKVKKIFGGLGLLICLTESIWFVKYFIDIFTSH